MTRETETETETGSVRADGRDRAIDPAIEIGTAWRVASMSEDASHRIASQHTTTREPESRGQDVHARAHTHTRRIVGSSRIVSDRSRASSTGCVAKATSAAAAAIHSFRSVGTIRHGTREVWTRDNEGEIRGRGYRLKSERRR